MERKIEVHVCCQWRPAILLTPGTDDVYMDVACRFTAEIGKEPTERNKRTNNLQGRYDVWGVTFTIFIRIGYRTTDRPC